MRRQSTNLAEPFELSLPAISKHLKVLEKAGLIVRSQQAQYRPRTLDPRPLKEVSTWAEQYRPIWEARFDRMDAYLTSSTKQTRTFSDHDRRDPSDSVTLERNFPAPPETIWKLWTQPEHFAAWYGPEGSTIPVATIDLRVGGIRLLCMEVTTPRGPMTMWFTGAYLEIVENRRLVYTDSMS